MTDTLTPPEGQSNFSGIPEAQFVEDVDAFMKGEENAEDKLKVRLLFSKSITDPIDFHRIFPWIFNDFSREIMPGQNSKK